MSTDLGIGFAHYTGVELTIFDWMLMLNLFKKLTVIIIIYTYSSVSYASTFSSPIIPSMPSGSMWSSMNDISGTLTLGSAYPNYNTYNVNYMPYQTPMIYASPWAMAYHDTVTVPALSSFGLNGYSPTSVETYNSNYSGTLFGGTSYTPDYSTSNTPSYLGGGNSGSGSFIGTTYVDLSLPSSVGSGSSSSSVLYPDVKPWGSDKDDKTTSIIITPKESKNSGYSKPVRIVSPRRPLAPRNVGRKSDSGIRVRDVDEKDLSRAIDRIPLNISQIDDICDDERITPRVGYSFKDYSAVFDIRMTENLNGVTTNMDFFKKVLCPIAKKLKNSDLTYRQRINIYAWLVAKIHQNYRRYGPDGDVYNIDYLWGGDLYDRQGSNGFYSKTSSRASGCRGNCGEKDHAFPTVGYDCSGYVFSVYKPIISNSVFSYRDVARSYKNKGREVLPTQSMGSSFINQVRRSAKPGDVFVSTGHIVIYGIDPVTGKDIVMENGHKISSLEAWVEKNRKMGSKYKVVSAFDKNDRPYTWGQPDAFMEDVIRKCR